MENWKTRIAELKQEKDALILAHFYQPMEIRDLADEVGDSFALAKSAQKASQSVIVLCGVRFMAESAKILNPGKTVYLPAEDAGCPMADMITPEQVLALRKQYPEAAVVCYVNSSAAVKAVSDVCCTSSSALRIVRALPQKQVIFIPDRNLGRYCAEQVPEKEIILFSGCCPAHDAMREADVLAAKKAHPEAKLLAHPECRKEILDAADAIGSTADILRFARESEAREFIIATENGVTEQLCRELPDRGVYPLREDFICTNMRKTTPEDVIACLEGRRKPLELPEEELTGALRSLERMVQS